MHARSKIKRKYFCEKATRDRFINALYLCAIILYPVPGLNVKKVQTFTRTTCYYFYFTVCQECANERYDTNLFSVVRWKAFLRQGEKYQASDDFDVSHAVYAMKFLHSTEIIRRLLECISG